MTSQAEQETAAPTSTSAQWPAWKVSEPVQQTEAPRVPLGSARQFFAVDASGSAMGAIMAAQSNTVQRLHAGRTNDKFVTWGSNCGSPVSNISDVDWSHCRGGTNPSYILRQNEAVEAISNSDLWYLFTDGEICPPEVQKLTELALETGVLNVPAIFVITQSKRGAPKDLNISVGITFFANAPDVLILFRDYSKQGLYVVAAKGCFAKLVGGDSDVSDLSTWEPSRMTANEEEFLELCVKEDIQLPPAENRAQLTSGLVRLGPEFERDNNGTAVDINLLLSEGGFLEHRDLEQLLAEEAFGNLSIACKTRARLQELRTFLQAQMLQEIVIKLEDVSGASTIVSQLSSPGLDSQTRETLQQTLRAAHANNRSHYKAALQAVKRDDGAARERNVLVNHALEDLAKLEKSSYTADILARSSNRARRAETVGAKGELPITVLDLESPSAFRGECHICCGENEVMCIAVKTGADGAANTDNFGLDFPLAAGRTESNRKLISSQLVCFQCTLASNNRSVFQEDLAAVIPTLEFTSNNRAYITDQVYKALTGGLRTGASGACQMFMTVLDATMRENEWARDGSNDSEVAQRRKMLDWMLRNMLENVSCRETFSDQGEWTTFAKALSWALRDFRDLGVYSWAIGYPVVGFNQLLRFGQRLGSFDEQAARDLRLAKVMHSVASVYLTLLFKSGHLPQEDWKQPLLETIYTRFNGNMVPTDTLNADSLVNDPAVFWGRLAAFLPADVELLANWDASDKERAMRRVQVLAFWLIYHQKMHTRAKSFFQTVLDTQELAPAVLDCTGPTLSTNLTNPVLLSIFRQPDSTCEGDLIAKHTGIVPFVGPFGASVLRCGFPACGEPFLPADQLPGIDERWTEKQCEALRQARAAHLIKIFSVNDKFGSVSSTGMPMVTASPTPPASLHINQHISIVRVWCQAKAHERIRIAGGDKQFVDAFVGNVTSEICRTKRGNVYTDDMEETTRLQLPSFVEALKVATARTLGEDTHIAEFVHDWDANTLQGKAKYEMRLAADAAGGKITLVQKIL
ncbi:hypothetical protein DRE_01432 [Drechslerella stenobrocha 248]|uniref:Uncharacterized protein n=1 Tax=Drechslerella stenobrocha 248 TaxID=1043628 RepID=W7I4A0_9PEZI|nr:hypothetical protein DRE_01432 [Drechslerella stenobrocha 248]